jgi:hypothetical protein
MATDKKHIAVYLDPAVEQALIAFCEQKGLISKKGFMYSAGVNAALAEFFSTPDIKTGNIPPNSGNILDNASNTLNNLRNIPAGDNIPLNIGNIPADDNIPLDIGNIPVRLAINIPPELSNIPLKSLVMEVLPGKQKA